MSQPDPDPQKRAYDDARVPNDHPSAKSGQAEVPLNDRKVTEVGSTKFSIYTQREKRAIIALAAMAGLFSPLTATSYFPAMGSIADAFNTSVELINVTVTVYMVLQGLSPMLWGNLSDKLGRRPLFLICLALLSVSCVGLALVPTDAYWLLLVLRCLQAAGSASTVALGSGVVSDIAEPFERGGFLGLFVVGPLIGPCIGPLVGGILAGNLGWRSVFWFLAIASGIYAIIFFLLFPETLRRIVGDGSVPAPHWNRPVIPILLHYDSSTTSSSSSPKKLTNPFRLFTHPSVIFTLLYNGTVYAVFYGVTASMSTLFSSAYPFLTESELGVCFLASGFGCALGSYLCGRFLDWEFRKVKGKFMADKAAEGQKTESEQELEPGKEREDFPFEYARFRAIPLEVAIYVISLIGYGWAVEKAVHISVPLIFLFFIALMITALTNTAQTFLLDLFPTQGSSITAANNLVRCTMAAALVSVVGFVLRALKPGWTYTLLGSISVLLLPMNWVVVRYGPKWRANRR